MVGVVGVVGIVGVVGVVGVVFPSSDLEDSPTRTMGLLIGSSKSK